MPKQKRTYLIEIEAKLVVDAFDEASARKKVERAFAANKSLDGDVKSTGHVWTYHAAPEEPVVA
jgi:hypothetical protein